MAYRDNVKGDHSSSPRRNQRGVWDSLFNYLTLKSVGRFGRLCSIFELHTACRNRGYASTAASHAVDSGDVWFSTTWEDLIGAGTESLELYPRSSAFAFMMLGVPVGVWICVMVKSW